MDEVWKAIPDTNNFEVSSYGRVKNISKNTILKPRTNSCGYYQIGYTESSGKRRTRTIHRLVAEAFIANPDNLETVNHKDGTRLNCEVSNLEWSTQAQNNEHAIVNGLQKTRPVVAYMGEEIRIFRSLHEAGRAVKRSKSSIYSVCAGKNKTCASYYWRYI